MSDLTVEMVQRGRGPSTQEAARRLGVAREIRSARERLTSGTGLERAFDHACAEIALLEERFSRFRED